MADKELKALATELKARIAAFEKLVDSDSVDTKTFEPGRLAASLRRSIPGSNAAGRLGRLGGAEARPIPGNNVACDEGCG